MPHTETHTQVQWGSNCDAHLWVICIEEASGEADEESVVMVAGTQRRDGAEREVTEEESSNEDWADRMANAIVRL